MKKIILLLFVSLSIINTHAQTNVQDSLKRLLQKEKTDTGRILLLADLSFLYAESKPDTTMILALQALELSRRIGFEKGEAISFNRIANAYHSLGNYPKSMESLLQALKINEKINNLDGIQTNFNNIGVKYFELGDYRQALQLYFKSKDLAEKNNNKRAISIVLGNIGEIYYHLKFFDSARLYTQQSYNIGYQINNFRTIGTALTLMGDIHFETGQNSLALEYYRLSIPYSEKAKNDLRLSQVFLGIAKVFEKTAHIDSSLYYAKKGVAIAKEKGFTKELLNASSFLYSFYKNSRNTDSAFYYLETAKALNDSLFSQQKNKLLQSLAFDEKIRQQEISLAESKGKEQRERNLQYAAIAVVLITFLILFFALSRSIIVKTKFIEFFGVLGLLAVFEFINLFIHPYLSHATNDSPVLMLLVLIGIGALLVPLHHRLEKWITKIMVEKNKKIRLAAAKKTIATLEGENI
jgi:tetratricopeptide (TPR) repeat protein